MRDKDRTNNKLNTPNRTNAEFAKRRANKTNDREYNYEFGQDRKSRYDYEFGNEANTDAKDSPLARGANIANAFSNPTAASADTASRGGNYGRYNEEYGRGQENAEGLKRKYQENLRQNYNVEFSDDELVDDNCDNCKNCPRRKR